MGAVSGGPALPAPIVQDILKQYADVLRVGRLLVNGSPVTWDTAASTAAQLQGFCVSLHSALRRLPEATGLGDAVLQRAAYWLCKALSINYALAEVLHLLSRRVGALCCIESCEEGRAGRVDYCAQLSRVHHLGGTVPGYGHTLGVSLDWKSRDNIVCRDPATAERTVKGTLSRLETEFPLPPACGFTPKYTLQLQLRRSLASQFISTVSCAETCSDVGGYCDAGAGEASGWAPSAAQGEMLSLQPGIPLRSADDEHLAGSCAVCPGGLLQFKVAHGSHLI
uniref:Uncharacterized protein n=1 Tax=Pyrodinium bahamense TaxID=73915 RepID=A0A7S0FDY5_9DINO|mmetsp:Transcript_2458/g.6956  ORF Transcript_2458/g.6956 Transcript_2458/m.6956 type:complete len:281 (+) Transcript_2458:124-966(+)